MMLETNTIFKNVSIHVLYKLKEQGQYYHNDIITYYK